MHELICEHYCKALPYILTGPKSNYDLYVVVLSKTTFLYFYSMTTKLSFHLLSLYDLFRLTLNIFVNLVSSHGISRVM